MTPPANWRPHQSGAMFLVGPASCQGCGATVWFGRAHTRVQGRTVMGEVRTWREWGRYAVHGCAPRASRARAKGYNVLDEYSVPIAHNAQRPSARLYSESEGVDVPEYRRNG